MFINCCFQRNSWTISPRKPKFLNSAPRKYDMHEVNYIDNPTFNSPSRHKLNFMITWKKLIKILLHICDRIIEKNIHLSSFMLMKNLDDKNVKNFIQLFILNVCVKFGPHNVLKLIKRRRMDNNYLSDISKDESGTIFHLCTVFTFFERFGHKITNYFLFFLEFCYLRILNERKPYFILL